jgi:hypothetical protein
MLESLSSLRMFASLRPWPWMMKTELLALRMWSLLPNAFHREEYLGKSRDIERTLPNVFATYLSLCLSQRLLVWQTCHNMRAHKSTCLWCSAYPLLLLDADSMSESWSKAIKIIDFATKKEIRVLKHVPQDNGEEVHRDETWNIAQSDQITSWASAKQELRVCRLHRRPYQKVRREKSHQFRWRSLDHTKAEDLASIPRSINLNRYYDILCSVM